MSDDSTPRLDLPMLAANQAQKHVTMNEALLRLDGLVHLSVAEARSHPPSAPEAGSRYRVVWPSSGAWSGHEGTIAERMDGNWIFRQPRTGWYAYREDVGQVEVFDGEDWQPLATRLGPLDDLTRLGIGTNATAETPLLAQLNQALLSAPDAGAPDIRLTLNRQGEEAVASVIFATDHEAGGEIGLTAAGVEIKTRAGGGLATALRIAPDGSVSVGPDTAFARLDVSGALKIGDGALQDGLSLGDPGAPLGPGTGVYMLRRDAAMTAPGSVLHLGGYSGLQLHVNDTPANPGGTKLDIAPDQIAVAVPIRPSVDNSLDLGSGVYRFASLYAANGVITTSDAQDKTDVEEEVLGVDFVRRLRPVSYRLSVGGWEDGAPRSGRRRHHGLIGQEVEAALKKTGVDFGGFVRTEEGRVGLRYEQFVPVLVKAVQELADRVETLEAELAGRAAASGKRSPSLSPSKATAASGKASTSAAPKPRRKKHAGASTRSDSGSDR